MRTDRATLALRRRFTRQFYRNNKTMFALALLITVLNALSNLVLSWFMQMITDAATGAPGPYTLLQLTHMSLGLLAAIILFTLGDYLTYPRFVNKAMRQYKDYAFTEITKKSVAAFTGENTATYTSALTNDATSIETNYLVKIFALVQHCLFFVGAFAMMLWYSPLLTLVAFALSALPVVVSLLSGNKLTVQEKRVSDRNEGFMGMVKDMLSGFSVIKSFKAEREVIRLFRENNRATEDAKRGRRRVELLIQSIGSLAGATAQFGVFLFGAYLALSGRGVTAGVVIVFVQLMNFVIMPISEVPKILANRKAANTLIDKLAAAVQTNVRTEGHQADGALRQAITLDNVSFAYGADTPVLHNVSARFDKGKSYAIVGASGSGKSTLLNLMMGASEAYQGAIRFDDAELRDIASDSLYDIVSIVQQDVFVFNSAIRDNITLYREFDAEDVSRAIDMSGLSDMIAERGTDYTCGENGAGLSGGEKQRIAIARCLLRKTPVLLVDEATAALDAATAHAVTSAILDITDLTRIVVTHRLEESLLRRYDGILTLRNGRVEEAGRFDELMEKKGYFYSLFTVSQ